MYKEALRQSWIEVNLSNLAHNINEVKKIIADDTEIIGVLKADAYGNGSVECANVMRENGISVFAVATIKEAILLREAGINDKIIILGLVARMCSDIVAEYDLTPVVGDYALAAALSEAGDEAGKTIDILFAIDTGMGRIGMQVDTEEHIQETIEELRRISELTGIRIEGLQSHFAQADGETRAYTDMQLELFDRAYRRFTEAGIVLPKRIFSNSAAVVDYPEAEFDAVRPGTILYGLYPSEFTSRDIISIKPVMSVKANIVYVKTVQPGTSVSYGSHFTAERESRIATISIGYADGYSRALSGRVSVIIKGKRAPVVGSICMDQCMIDVTDIPGVEQCDVATIVGRDGDEEITMEELAEAIGTINLDIMCGFGKRLPKVFVE